MVAVKKIRNLVSEFSNQSIMVVGDLILDRYVFGHVKRISPEAPVPVVRVSRDEARPGGAGNVACNIRSLNGNPIIVSACGTDQAGDWLARKFGQEHLILRSSNLQTVVKTRVISQRQQIVRIDRETGLNLQAKHEEELISRLSGLQVSGIVVSDYAKGTLTPAIMDALKNKSRRDEIPLIVDPKPANISLYHNVTGITPNLLESEQMLGNGFSGDEETAAAARSLQKKIHCNFVVLTRGDQGITAVQSNRRSFHIPAFSHEVYDVTGAGDTVAATLALALACRSNLREAVYMANLAASVVIEKIGTAQVTGSELLKRLKSLKK